MFTQTHSTRHPVPWGQIAPGDPVWMKWCGGPLVAKATVQGFRQIEACTPSQLRETTRGFKLYDLDEYWRTRPPVFSGLTIYLEDETWLDHVIEPAGRSRGESWIVLKTSDQEGLWLQPGHAPTVPAPPSSNRTARGSRTLPAALRFEVFRRDSFTCTYCGRTPPTFGSMRIIWCRGRRVDHQLSKTCGRRVPTATWAKERSDFTEDARALVQTWDRDE